MSETQKKSTVDYSKWKDDDFNLNQAPDPGNRGYFNEWFKRYLDNSRNTFGDSEAFDRFVKQHPERFDRDTVAKSIIQARFQGASDVDRHRGFFKKVTANPGTWLTPFLGWGDQLDDKWVQQVQSARTPSDPIEAAKHMAYMQGMSPYIGKDARTTARRESAAQSIGARAFQHSMAGVVDDMAKGFTGGRYRGLYPTLTGKDSRGHLDEYARQYFKDTGSSDAAWEARAKVNAAGWAAAVAENAAELAMLPGAMGKLMSYGKSLQATRYGKYVAPIVKYIPRMYHVKPYVTGLKAMGDLMSNGGENNGLVSRMITGTGNIVESMPKYTSMMEYMPLMGGVADKIVGAVPKAGPWVQSNVSPAVAKLYAYAMSSSPAGWKGKAISAGKQLVHSTMVSPVTNIKNKAQEFIGGKEPEELTFGIVPDMALNLGEAAVDQTRTGYTFNHSGETAESYNRKMDRLDSSLSARDVTARNMGMAPGSDAQSVKDERTRRWVDEQSMSMVNELNAATGGKALQPWDSLSDEDRAMVENKKYEVYKTFMTQGGPLDFDGIFGDPAISPAHKKELLGDLLLAEDRASGGKLKTNFLSEGITAMTMGKGYIGGRAVKASDNARKAAVSYLSNASNDIKNSGDPVAAFNAAFGGDEIQGLGFFIDALTDADIDKGFGPLADMSPSSLLAITQSFGGASKPGTERVVDRLNRKVLGRIGAEPEYRKDFLVSLAASESDPAVSGDMRQQYMEAFDKADKKDTMDRMSATELASVAHYLRQQASSGEGADDPDNKARVEQWTEAIKGRAKALVKEDFTGNLPVLAGMWADSKGWDSTASFLSNSTYFWSTAFLLLSGTALMGASLLGSGNDKDADSIKSEAKLLDEQRRLLMKDELERETAGDSMGYLRALT